MLITLLTGRVNYIMNDKNNNKNNSQLNQTDVTQDVTHSKKKETFIVLYERYLLDGNLDLLDKLFYAFFVSLHCAGRVIDISNSQLREKIQVSPGEFISIDKVKRSLKKLEDMDYIKRYTNKNNGTRIITPVIKHEFDEIDESKADVFYDRYGNEYRPVDKNAPRGKFAPPLVQNCTTYNIKENIKENYIHNSQYIEPKKKRSYSEEFENFWSCTNKRGEKTKAYSAWKTHKLDKQLETMIDLIKTNYELKYGDREVRYQPHISTWINYRPWEEGAVKTEEEIIAKAQEQLQATKDNLPSQVLENLKPLYSVSERFKQLTHQYGLIIQNNLIESFLDALKERNIPIYQSNIEIIIEELQKMKFSGLDINDCIKKFLLSSWKSFSIDYFQKKKAKRESLSNPFALHNQLKNKDK
tara:strand:- start:1328 stop:2566 length:1239 start_codon:yes stop_codon:yes gene_type:complete